MFPHIFKSSTIHSTVGKGRGKHCHALGGMGSFLHGLPGTLPVTGLVGSPSGSVRIDRQPPIAQTMGIAKPSKARTRCLTIVMTEFRIQIMITAGVVQYGRKKLSIV
jgi:hypothetical protein